MTDAPAKPDGFASSVDSGRDLDELAVAVVRGLVIDMVEEAGTGHPGTAMSLAPLLHVLLHQHLRCDPAEPSWADRDRLVLSCGHAVAVLYALLHLTGYPLTLDELRNFRKPCSTTPGHPEHRTTPGIDATTGPLGQGVAQAVGMALAESMLRARHGAGVCDHWTYVIAGDGDMQEGISHEAAALAGHWGLGRLVCIYDDNDVTLDGPASLSMSEDVGARFRAYGWRVRDLGTAGEDLAALREALSWARQDHGVPTLLTLHTRIGHPAPNMAGDVRCHGQPLGPQEARLTRAALRIPLDESFWIPKEVARFYRKGDREKSRARQAWERRQTGASATTKAPPAPSVWIQPPNETLWEGRTLLSPRDASRICLRRISSDLPGVVVGSADITVGTGTDMADEPDYSATVPTGRQLRFGIREHGMAGIMCGLALHGGLLPVGGTYLAFSDYLRPALRLAALSGLPLVLCLTHDGLDCAEDGPTHHAPEHLAALRAMLGVRVLRPGDAGEVSAAWEFAVSAGVPVVMVLGRQPVPVLAARGAGGRVRGAYVLQDEAGSGPDAVLIGTGTEIHLCMQSAALLRERGHRIRVVSAPCWGLFDEQPESYRNDVLPAGIPRFAVEAGVAFGWVGRATPVAAVDQLGPSGPAAWLRTRYGLTADRIADSVHGLLSVGP